MCSAGASTVLQAIGLGAQIYGSKVATKAAQASADYAQAVAKNNSIIAGYQADDARLRGELEVSQLKRNVSRMRGTGRAAIAAGNVQVGSGSALSWEEDLAEESTRERLKIERTSELEQWGFKYGDNGQQQADILQARARAEGAASRVSNITSIIGAASQFTGGFDFGTPSKKKKFKTTIGPDDVAVER